MDNTDVTAAQPFWPKRLTLTILCFVASFVCYIDRVTISIAVIAMQEHYGWNEAEKGFLLSSFFIGYLLFQTPSGLLANRYGGKIVMVAALVWWSLCTILTPLAAAISLPLLYLTRIAMGLGEAATFPAAYYFGARWFTKSERSRFIAVVLSGSTLGTVFALLITGGIVTSWGWQSVFYIFGGVGFVVVAAWLLFAHDTPQRHPTISAAERTLLASAEFKTDEKVITPWGAIMSKPAVWALIFNHFACNWIFYVLLGWLPTFFRETQNLSLIDAGLFSAAPWLTMFLMVNLGAWSADALIARKVSVTLVRKVFQIIGLVCASLFLLLARDAGNAMSALTMMCCALGGLGLTWAAFSVNHLDIAPRHAAVLLGITNSIGTIPGVIGIAITGWLVDRTGSFDAPFLLAAAIASVAVVLWLLFATGEKVVD